MCPCIHVFFLKVLYFVFLIYLDNLSCMGSHSSFIDLFIYVIIGSFSQLFSYIYTCIFCH